jgi:hypothetical protein
MINNFKPLIDKFKNIELQAYNAYKPEVDCILSQKITNVLAIETLLDGMINFCLSNKMLALFKQLCRYYWEIDPQATATHINFYREMWDDESLEKDNTRKQ